MKRVGIVGLGLIGGSLGLALKEHRHDLEVLGVARRLETAEAAVARGAVDRAGIDLGLLRDADLVVLCCPLRITPALLVELPPVLSPGTRVTDVGSVKGSVVEAASRALDPARNPFLGGHPMAGKEVTGIEHAEAGLFRGRPWIFTPRTGSAAIDGRPVGFEDLIDLVIAIGASPAVMAPRDHDRCVALVSHLPFLVSAAYLAAAGASPDWGGAAMMASSGFRDVSRLGAGDPGMYAAIVESNLDNVRDVWTLFHAALDELEAAFVRGEREHLLRYFESARGVRRAWEERRPPAARPTPEPGP